MTTRFVHIEADSWYDFGNYVTIGGLDAVTGAWDGAETRYNNFTSDPSLFSFVNYATMGTDELVVGAVNPDEQFSADHWLSSMGLAGFFAGGAGVATRGAVNSLKPGPRSSTSVEDIKAARVSNNSTAIDPKEIRFSQSSVNGSQEIIDSMRLNGWKGDPIDIVEMTDGGLTTIDNTRVAAARKAGIDVVANVRKADDPLPENMIDRFTTKKGVPKTWGEADPKKLELWLRSGCTGFNLV